MGNSTTSVSVATLSTPLLIALVTLKGYQETKNGKELYIEDLAQYLVQLRTEGIDIGRISLSRSLDKYWSEDVAQFVSEGLVFGFLTHKSPLEFSKKCIEVCKRAIDSRVTSDSNLQSLVDKAERILGLESIEALAS